MVLKPGLNEINLSYTPKTPGKFKLGQISLLVEEKLEFLSNCLANTKVGYDVVTQGVNVYLNKVEPKKDLVSGLEHLMELVVTSGSSHIEKVNNLCNVVTTFTAVHTMKNYLSFILMDMKTN